MEKARDLNRRDLVRFGGLGLITAALTGCITRGQSTLNTSASPTESITPTSEITGTFPVDRFEFSQTILEHNLVPTVLPEQMWAFDRMLSGVDYLQRLAPTLAENPETNTATLGDIVAVGDESYPIALNESDSALSIIQNFLQDIENKRVVIWGGSMPEVPYLVGTINNPIYRADTGWFMESQIHANLAFPFGNPRPEESGTTYRRYTDLQVGLKMLHEYAHCRQGQEFLEQIVAEYGEALAERGYDMSHAAELIDTKVDTILNEMNQDPRIGRNKIGDHIAFNEAQANQVSQLVLWAVNSLNNGRMPGTEDDSYPVSSDSLYQTFQRAIVQEKNPYDSTWLTIHSNW